MDAQYNSMNEKFKEMQKKLDEEHLNQLNALKVEFETKHNNETAKLSSDVLNLQKRLHVCVRQKEYPKAHSIQQEIIKKTNNQNLNFEGVKQRMLQQEIDNLKRKQALERQELCKKKNTR